MAGSSKTAKYFAGIRYFAGVPKSPLVLKGPPPKAVLDLPGMEANPQFKRGTGPLHNRGEGCERAGRSAPRGGGNVERTAPSRSGQPRLAVVEACLKLTFA